MLAKYRTYSTYYVLIYLTYFREGLSIRDREFFDGSNLRKSQNEVLIPIYNFIIFSTIPLAKSENCVHKSAIN